MKTVSVIFISCIYVVFTLGLSYGKDAPKDHPQKITVGGNYDYPPYEFIGEDGNPTGYSTELTYALAEVMGVSVDVILDSWKTTRERLETGKIDAIHGMYYSKERDTLVDFSPPHTIIYNSVFSRDNIQNIESLEDLRGKNIVVVEKGALHEYLKRSGISDNIILVDSDGAALRLVSSGKYDYALLGKLPGIYISKKLKLTNLKPSGPPILPFKYCFAVKDGNLAFLSRINESLAILKKTGRYQQIYNKWLGVYEPKTGLQNPALKYLTLIVIAVILIITIGTFWVKILKKQVSERTIELEIEVNERKQAEESLRESEERFRSIIENTDAGFFFIDRDGIIKDVNDSWVKLYGYSSAEEIIGQHFTVIQKPDDIEKAKEFVDGIIRGNTKYLTGEFSRKCQDGSIGYHTFSARPVQKNGVIIGLEGFIIDTTDRTQAENALRESEYRYTAAMEASKDGLYDWDLVTNEIYYSPGWKRMVGYSEDELSNNLSVWGKLTNPQDVKRSWIMQQELINKQRDRFEMEFKMKHKDEHWIDVLSRAKAIFDKDGEAIRIVGTHVDITERKKVELSLRENHQVMLKSQRLAKLGNWKWDVTTGKVEWSEEVYRIFGLNPSEFQPQIDSIMSYFHPDDQHQNEEIMQAAIMNGEQYSYETRILLPDNSVHNLYSISEGIFDKRGNLTHMTGIVQDVTELRQVEEEKKLLQSQLIQSQKLESIGNLAGGIAHDFNNILSSVIGFTELALDEVEKETTIEDSLQEVYAAGKRAKDLVKQILAFARQSDEKLKPIQVDLIVKEVLQFIRSSIPTTIEIKQDIESESLIIGNPTQIHQVLMNLCTNAAHAMEDEGGILDVILKDVVIDSRNMASAGGIKPGDYIEIKVSDTGAGISPVILASIFEPYFTTKPPGEGTGMGLAMVHGIVESYSGEISVNSTLGQGTVFTIYLPITRKRKTNRLYESLELPMGTERILFVDDEAPIAKMGSQGLERLGYKVTTRTSSVEALELFKQKRNDFDLVITDMTMPNMTGDTLATE